jgi:integrase
LITVSWETGCRPQESLNVEARHLDVTGNRWVFPASESKGNKIPRVVYLTPKALEISERLAAKHPQGVLFRNKNGRPWTPTATGCRFWRIKAKVGGKVSLYALRHTWMNRMLIGGVDAFTVATLAGHRDPSMLAKHYAHLSQAPGYLSQQAMRAAG